MNLVIDVSVDDVLLLSSDQEQIIKDFVMPPTDSRRNP